MLSTPWEKWRARVDADRQNSAHPFQGGTYDFDTLVEMRKPENLAAQITPEKWQSRHAACHAALDVLAVKYAEAAPDVAVIVGNDQRELFTEENNPAFAIFWGATIENRPRTAEQIANLPPGIAISERGHAPPEDAVYPGQPELGQHIIGSMMDAGFDVAASDHLPKGSGYVNGVPHAFGFIYRQIMKDRVVPNVPVFINTFYPPNQPSAARCRKFGEALGRAIERWDSDARVAVFGSGGLSHFVIDEDLDREVLDAFQASDMERLEAIPDNLYQSGTSEIKNWIPLAAMMAARGRGMTLVDYVPCYRSEAGTGNAMGFAYWD
jgi:3-O-methylgallate 3,4-dioxygenase